MSLDDAYKLIDGGGTLALAVILWIEVRGVRTAMTELLIHLRGVPK